MSFALYNPMTAQIMDLKPLEIYGEDLHTTQVVTATASEPATMTIETEAEAEEMVTVSLMKIGVGRTTG